MIEVGIFDLWILRPALDMYPRNPLTSAEYVTEEVIYRFGIMAITFRLTRSVTAAVITAAFFNVASTIPGAFLEEPKASTAVMCGSAAKALVFATFYGFFCARKGLYSTVVLRMIVGLKFVAYAFLGI